MRSEWYLPVGLSLVLLSATAGCLYGIARLEMSRDGAAGVVTVAIAAQLLMMAVWVFGGPV